MPMTIRIRQNRLRVTLATALPALLLASPAFAAQCPTSKDPQNLKGAFPGQVEIEDAGKAGVTLTYTQNPLFDEDTKAGKLPQVAERLPEQPLIELPYETCGKYGGTLRGLSRAPESGTSDILSWRQVNLVRIADDLKTIEPDVARSWTWNKDYTAITFEFRKRHK
mgnify:CR=1 FL=1